MKVKAKIKVIAYDLGPVRKSKARMPSDVKCKGRIVAEGKKAVFPFCYRSRVLKEDAWGKKTGVELHSRVTGKLIGYMGPQSVFVTDPAQAMTLDSLNAFQVPMIMRNFMMDAQAKSTNKYLARDYREKKQTLQAIIKAAKK